jgi:hypothetical protein
MPTECMICRDLLLGAGRAIVAHLRAVSRLEEAVIAAYPAGVCDLEEDAVNTAIARENAVRAYEEHRSVHEKQTARTATGL